MKKDYVPKRRAFRPPTIGERIHARIRDFNADTLSLFIGERVPGLVGRFIDKIFGQ